MGESFPLARFQKICNWDSKNFPAKMGDGKIVCQEIALLFEKHLFFKRKPIYYSAPLRQQKTVLTLKSTKKTKYTGRMLRGLNFKKEILKVPFCEHPFKLLKHMKNAGTESAIPA